MKRILITGEGSYVGEALRAHLAAFPEAYAVDTVDVRGGAPATESFVGYDAVVHVAGIVHQKGASEELYDRVNRALAVTVGERAREAGVSQLIFFSTMNVYGRDHGRITKDTAPAPRTPYGRSKLAAEEALGALRTDRFAVCILRPPMIYGKGCRGNFQSVVRLAQRLPVFPRVKNRRSLLFIGNLTAFLRHALDERLDGLFFPRDGEALCTADIARAVATARGKRMYFSVLLGGAVLVARPFLSVLRKAFGTLLYEDMGDGTHLVTPYSTEEALTLSLTDNA